MVQIDLHYPSFLHWSHNDLPLAPQKLQFNSDWLSSYALSFGLKPSGTAKLVETLLDKLNYVCHLRNLQFYVQQGLEVKALHKVLQFKQSSWPGKYIFKNTSMRKRATSDFEKNFYKLMSNACFGKNMENLRNRRVIKFVVNEMQAKKNHLQTQLQVIQHHQSRSSIRAPHNYFHCMEQTYASWIFNFGPVKARFIKISNEMKPRYGDSLTVVNKDTESLLHRIETDDLSIYVRNFAHLLDLSDFPQNHKLHDPTNIKIPLTNKDKVNGITLEEVVCIRLGLSKIKFSGGVKQSANVVPRSVIKTLNHDLFHLFYPLALLFAKN